MRFQNSVVIITGGASGIGEATAKAFAAEGAHVVIADFSDHGKKVAEELNTKGNESIFIKTDVTSEESIKYMVSKTVEKFKRIDVLFANAGIAMDNSADNLTVANWQKTIDVNLTGVFLCDKFVIHEMLKQKSGGVIVNCGSIHSFVSREAITAYTASKGGVKLLTQTLAIDYAKNHIRVNTVCPGYINTPLLSKIPDDLKKQLISLHPLGRLGVPEEVAKAVLFLASNDASFITGTTLIVDGGYTAQ
ncbi:SDR family NAD(P)-dependent oxidoreductase [Xenorhabdus innexi]|uniref:Bacilysin biosynthesis oxidoreductase BacC n=1 Tax=Xenorhabdus innexi TaxID=290109 RepID=A0A1N6MTG8_9GAMM|nr:glucose 1-dehydrogenase [Xenorhabdus innexi]PHM35711.1 short-chain type dehydrogenase/reductase [Xenorhabdus innexi]SIP72111.1 Bacilysin biosynthesis oxidoreductase BacC [Xenorhabdus innexi]